MLCCKYCECFETCVDRVECCDMCPYFDNNECTHENEIVERFSGEEEE